MIRALLLILDPSRTWEKIKGEQYSVVRISTSFLLPLLLLASVAEGLGLAKFGVGQSSLASTTLVRPSNALIIRYELTQVILTLVIVYAGSVALKAIGASFHRRHSYQECLTTLAYSISPLLLMRIVDGFPAIHTWACYGVGVFLALSLFYRGIPVIMRPDPSNALGLFVFCSFLLLVATGLAHFVATQVLDEKLFISAIR